MNASASRIARTLLLAALASAIAVGCSKKVKEEPPTATVPSTGTTTTPVDAQRSSSPPQIQMSEVARVNAQPSPMAQRAARMRDRFMGARSFVRRGRTARNGRDGNLRRTG